MSLIDVYKEKSIEKHHEEHKKLYEKFISCTFDYTGEKKKIITLKTSDYEIFKKKGFLGKYRAETIHEDYTVLKLIDWR